MPIWLLAAVAVFPIAAVLIFLQQGQSAWQLRLGDSDNYMRLVQVRDLLAGQGWHDLVQHRVNPPDGLDTHWSRLADLPYAVPILLLRPLLGADLAERLVVVAVPPLLLLLTMIVLARLSERLAGWRGAGCACLLLAVSGSVLAQFVPGRIDHHGLQMLLLVTTLCAALGPERVRSGVAAAAACALSLAVGLETAPYLVLVAAWVAGRWLVHGPPARAKAKGFFLGLAVLAPALLLLTVPTAEWPVAHSDAFSGGHVAVIAVGSLALLAAMAIPGASRFGGRALASAGAATLAVLTAAQLPALWSAPYSEVDPAMTRLWIERIAETRSYFDQWRQSPPLGVAGLWFIAAAAVIALVWAAFGRGRPRDPFVLLALLTSMGAVLAVWQARGDAAATSMAVPVAAAGIARLWEEWQRGTASVLPLAAAAILLNPISVRSALTIAERSLSGRPALADRSTSRLDRCSHPADFARLAAQQRGLVLNPIDQSATILARTGHSVIAAGNHRNAVANGWVYRAFAADPAAAAPLIRRLRADYVVYCPDAPETRKIASFAPNGLLGQLGSGRIPGWLEEVGPRQGRGLRVLRTRWIGRTETRSGSPWRRAIHDSSLLRHHWPGLGRFSDDNRNAAASTTII
jgi:hypothetical protein